MLVSEVTLLHHAIARSVFKLILHSRILATESTVRNLQCENIG